MTGFLTDEGSVASACPVHVAADMVPFDCTLSCMPFFHNTLFFCSNAKMLLVPAFMCPLGVGRGAPGVAAWLRRKRALRSALLADATAANA